MLKRYVINLESREYTVHVHIDDHGYQILGVVDETGYETDVLWLEKHYLDIHELLVDRIIKQLK